MSKNCENTHLKIASVMRINTGRANKPLVSCTTSCYLILHFGLNILYGIVFGEELE